MSVDYEGLKDELPKIAFEIEDIIDRHDEMKKIKRISR